MIILPAIDLRDGKCVRLVEGKLAKETIYGDDPAQMALKWEILGAKYIHLVDLDGAFAGKAQNMEVVKSIVKAIKIPAEIGGGIRDLETIDIYFNMGIDRVILGSTAISNPQMVEAACKKYGQERIVLGVDARDGKVAIHGWDAVVEKTAIELAVEMKELGVTRVIYTDISRDGTLTGPNLDSTKELAQKAGLKVIASGGMSDIEDVKAVKALEPFGVEGVIIGKALYDERINLKEALAIAEGKLC